MVKVYGSETLDYVVDEGVQIHGGYGYHQDYAVERGYRDARINRLFEGTSEINRLLITGMLLKRAARGDLAVVPAVQALIAGKPKTTISKNDQGADSQLIQKVKDIALLAIGAAFQKYGMEMQKQQEVLMNISDIIMEVLAMESSFLRAEKLERAGRGHNAADMTAVLLREGMDRVEVSCRAILGSCVSSDALQRNMSVLRDFANYEPVDAIMLRRNIARRIVDAERYVVD
jgi:hypothetical protein